MALERERLRQCWFLKNAILCCLYINGVETGDVADDDESSVLSVVLASAVHLAVEKPGVFQRSMNRVHVFTAYRKF